MSEQQSSDELSKDHVTDSEFAAIDRMLDAAEANGLEVEVIWSFAQEMRHGSSIETACAIAIHEWDL